MKSQGLPRNPRIKYHFQNNGFEFFFQWILGSQTHGGAEIGECLYAASKIEDGNPESWYTTWTELAQRVEKRAEISFKNRHIISAREGYLRSYIYYRASIAFLSPRKDCRYKDQWLNARTCFRKAIGLFEPQVELVAIAFEDKTLPGYFLKVDGSKKRHQTLIMIGGADTFVEDLYFYIGPAATKRGYNVLMVDLPGQGGLPFDGLVMREDSEIPMSAVVDYALSQPTVDADRIAAYGISAGGYLVPRAVTLEKRIKACVACSIILDFSAILPSNISTLEHSFPFRVMKTLQPWKLQAALNLLDTYMWRWGTDTLAQLCDILKTYTLNPSLITCPTFNLVAEQEYMNFEAGRLWASECLDKIANLNNELIVAPQNEGADSHAVGTNLSLMSQIIFDWLDDVLQPESQFRLNASPVPV